MNKKGMDLPINVIVLIVIAMVVLIVILLLFQNTMSKSGKKLDGVTDPIEIKTRCLSWEKYNSFTDYDNCVKLCTDSPESYKEACFYG